MTIHLPKPRNRFTALGSPKMLDNHVIMEVQNECPGGTVNTPERDQQPIVEVPVMPILASPKYYVYILCRPNGKPFYVGKGSGDRVYQHDREARSGHQCYKCNVIRKIWREGGEVQRYIVFETDDEQEAFTHEVDLIELYNLETLTNQTPGGSGPPHTDAVQAKVAATLKKRLADPEIREQYRQRAKALWDDPAFRSKCMGIPQSAESRAKRSRALKDRFKDPVYRESHRENAKKAWRDPAYKAEMREKLGKATSTPEFAQLSRDRMVKLNADPDFCKKRSERIQAIWDDPVRRAELLAKRAAALAKKRSSDDKKED